MLRKAIYLFVLLSITLSAKAASEKLSSSDKTKINKAVTAIIDSEVKGGSTKISSYSVKGRKLKIEFSSGLANFPFREKSVLAIYDTIRDCLPEKMQKYKIEAVTDKHLIEDLIPLPFRSKIDRKEIITFTNRSNHPLVSRESKQVKVTKGLQNRHIALWQSHGIYFDQRDNRWEWQRTAQWQTREDLFTQSFVLPFLIPMLENAGANVLTPRERDVQLVEIVIDNEQHPTTTAEYWEHNGKREWQDAGVGFGHSKLSYMDGENPFKDGHCRKIETITSGKESVAVWQADIAQTGEYAVYVSYKSLAQSSEQALYTVRHSGGESRFRVNQTMGGGTWVYLGTFQFDKGDKQPVVTLSNSSKEAGKYVVADAVKLGGGYGSIARIPADSLRSEEVDYYTQLSGYPRYCEGARYWLQWAGFSPEIYSPKGFSDDYKDDFMSRAHWVNALMGGSQRLPNAKGLSIPIDLALAFHSDAGIRNSEQTIGTLGIFYTKQNKGLFEGGASRYLSRDLTDVVMSEIVENTRSVWEPDWRRRALWNRSYYEARVPSVPTMLLELLSHQNFADMRLGHDPQYKFMVSRAIYKGILKHIATQYNYQYVVQPLPVCGFSAKIVGKDGVQLKWHPRKDSLEKSAIATYYMLYTSIDGKGFDNGRRVESNECRVEQELGRHYRYRITACNEGGESFPSETLAVCILANPKGEVLIVNGFDRVSAPASFRSESEAGFTSDYDSGVSYMYDISFIGEQQIYDRALHNVEDVEKGLGGCSTEYDGQIVAGNTFDFVALHGASIVKAGYSYCSASLSAVERGEVNDGGYSAVDLILGKQRSSFVGEGVMGNNFNLYSKPLQEFIRKFTLNGVNLFVSGSYLSSDLWEGEFSSDEDREFAREVLHYEHSSSRASESGRVRGTMPEMMLGEFGFNRTYSPDIYRVDSPDALLPVGDKARPCLRYNDSSKTAAIAYDGEQYRVVVMGFPFETIIDSQKRDMVMNRVLNFLNR